MKAGRIIVNAPSTHGGIGDVYNAFIPSLTLGCGSYGQNSVSTQCKCVKFIKYKKIGSRNNNMQWFKVPPKIYFEKNATSIFKKNERHVKGDLLPIEEWIN